MASAHAPNPTFFCIHANQCELSNHGSWEHLVNLELVAFAFHSNKMWDNAVQTSMFRHEMTSCTFKCVDSLTFLLNSVWIHDPGHHHCQLHRSGPGATSARRGQDTHVEETCEDTHTFSNSLSLAISLSFCSWHYSNFIDSLLLIILIESVLVFYCSIYFTSEERSFEQKHLYLTKLNLIWC